MDSLYYRIFLKDQKSIVFFVAILRSLHDNLVFDRTEKPKEHTFELFLNQSGEKELLEILQLLIKKNIIVGYEKKELGASSLFQYQ